MGLNALDFKVLVGGTDLKQAGVIISSLSLDCSVEKADSFHMVVEYGFNMYTAFSDLHADLVLGKEVQVDLGYVDDLTTAFQGYITSIKIEVAEEPQEARVVISGLDKSLVLMKTVKSRSFLKKKYSDIASTIAGETGLSAVVDATDQTYDYIEQPGISDYQLLSSLAEKSGREFFVSAGKLYFRKLPEGGSSVKTLKFGVDLLRLNLESDLADQAAGVVVTGWDRRKKEMVKGEASSPTLIGSGKSGVAFLGDLSVSSKLVENYHAHIDAADRAKTLATARLQSLSLKMVSGTATCVGIPSLKAGTYVTLSGLGSRFDMKYYVRAVNHTMDEQGFITVISLGGNSA